MGLISLSPPSSFILFCLEAIINTHSSPGDHVVVLDIDLKLNFPHILLNHATDLENKPQLRKPDLYLADLEETSLNETLSNFQSKTTFNPRAKFVFLAGNVTVEDVDVLSENFISKVVFVDVLSGVIKTYQPYKNKAIHDLNKEVSVVNNCSNLLEKGGKDDDLFQDKVPKLWNNSMIKFCYLPEPPYAMGPEEESKGLNLDIFDFIASLIQLKPSWKSLKYPDNGDLNTYTKESVSTKQGCDLTSELPPFEGVDFTQPHVYDEIPFFVPTPAQIPRWQYLLKTLTKEIWMSWIFTCVLISSCWAFVYLVLEKKWDPMKMLGMLWLNLEYFIEKSRDVSLSYLSLRLLFLLVILQSFLLNMIFKCNFNLVLSGIIFEEPISSLVDIVDRRIVFGLFQMEELDNILEVVGDRRKEVLYSPCDNSRDCWNRTAFRRDMALHQSLRAYRYFVDDYLDEQGSPLMIKLEPPYSQAGLGGVLPLGHPLTPILDEFILKLHAFGFNEFFVGKYDRGKENKLSFQLKLTKLTLEHIIAPAAVLIVGYLTGLALFLLEVRRGYMKKRLSLLANTRNF